ncbi:MAG: hypothetical protein AAGF11_09660 [Myxococcota bacterium]
MARTTIETIRELADRFRDNERNLTLYFADLETAPAPGSYNRVFGSPVGLTDAQWPTFPELAELLLQAGSMQHWDPSDQRMEHVFTIDLRGVTLVGVPEDAAAMMLFISNASFHRACADGNPHTTVLFLSADDLRRGPYQGDLPRRSLYRWSRRFSLVSIDVPGEVFDVPELDLPADDPLVELYDAIADAPARLGGCPIGLQADQDAAWGESSPTLPWGDNGSESSEAAEPALDSSQTVLFDPGRHADSSRTVPYLPPRMAESSLTVPYEPSRGLDPSAAAPLRHPAGAPHAGATTSVSLSYRTPKTSPASPFLMQFHRRFADVNLGQQGVMYVSDRSAYFQSRSL